MSDFNIRTMQRDELDLALSWASQEGWNPGINDAHCYYQADPQGFFVGELKGEVIASISAIKYSGDFGFIGFYMVKEKYRHQGFGIQLWKAALDYLSGCNIGLDGVAEQQANYQKSGFKLAYANIRFQGVKGKTLLSSITSPRYEGQVNQKNIQILPLSDLSFGQIAEYEKAFFPCERQEFLASWIGQESSYSLAAVQDGNLIGYGVMRQCVEGYKLAPLFADTPHIAEHLLIALVEKIDDDAAFFLDVPECHQAGLMLAKKMMMAPVFSTARMYTKTAPVLPLGRIYGVTSFEIG